MSRAPVIPPPPECLLHGPCRVDGSCTGCEASDRRVTVVLGSVVVLFVGFFVWLYVWGPV